MGMPYFVEYMLALRSPSGGVLCDMWAFQVLFENVPPGIRYKIEYRPIPHYFAIWTFRGLFGSDMVPDAWTMQSMFAGAQLVTGLMTQTALRAKYDVAMLITDANPYSQLVENVSKMVQKFEFDIGLIGIESNENLDLIYKELDKLKVGDELYTQAQEFKNQAGRS